MYMKNVMYKIIMGCCIVTALVLVKPLGYRRGIPA